MKIASMRLLEKRQAYPSNNFMKTLLITIPIRPTPSEFPPIGMLSIMQAMRKAGIDNFEFYNIDGNRPSYKDALKYIIRANPDIIFISAVVSTSYSYIKNITRDIRSSLPNVLIVVGGSMAASAEILLKRTNVDICVTGEGEITNCNIIKQFSKTRDIKDLVNIRGIVMLIDNRLLNTGYEEQISKEHVYDIDWEDLEKSSDINQFMVPAFNREGEACAWFKNDQRTYEPHRKNKTVASLPCSKGCIARCTFCHRFTSGIRYIPNEIIEQRIVQLIKKYNVGFISIVDENFGTDKRWLNNFCSMIKKYDLLWRVAGMRVNTSSPEKMQMMKDSGCTTAIYGMETGSPTILKVMEKRVHIEDNYNAIKWTVESGLDTTIQLIVGMPGETPETIAETCRFVKYGMSLSPEQFPNNTSINYAQALPGTPLYEYARNNKLIGQGLQGEEDYLISISDKDAADELTTLNFTKSPKLLVETWKSLITIEVNYHYVKKYGLHHYYKKLLQSSDKYKETEIGGKTSEQKVFLDSSFTFNIDDNARTRLKFNRKDEVPSIIELFKKKYFGLLIICYPRLAYRLRMLLPVAQLLMHISKSRYVYSAKISLEYLKYAVSKIARFNHRNHGPNISLRKLTNPNIGQLYEDNFDLLELRKGR